MGQDLKNNPKIVLGNVELPDGFLDRKNHKLRITTFIDGDIYDELQKRAAALGGKYQSLLNKLLRDVLFGSVAKEVVFSNELIERLAKNVSAILEKKEKIKVDGNLVAASKKKKPKHAGAKKRVG